MRRTYAARRGYNTSMKIQGAYVAITSIALSTVFVAAIAVASAGFCINGDCRTSWPHFGAEYSVYVGYGQGGDNHVGCPTGAVMTGLTYSVCSLDCAAATVQAVDYVYCRDWQI